MIEIPFVKKELIPMSKSSIKRSELDLKGNGGKLTLCIESRIYDQHCLSDNTSEKDIHSVVYAYIEETGEPWTIEYYPAELTEKEIHDGMMNILENPHKYCNLQHVKFN